MATTQYITIAEWREGIDVRTLQQLGSDDGTPLVGDPPTDSDGVLVNCIERASADVERAALIAGRYTEVELDALVASDDWTLKGLVASLATKHLYRRRGGSIPADVQSLIDEAMAMVQKLEDGARIFNITAAVVAGQPKAERIDANQRRDLNLVSDSEFFPVRETKTVT